MHKTISRAGLALLICSCVEPAFGYLAAPSDPAILPVAKNLYDYLASRAAASTNKVILGQHLGSVGEIQQAGEFDINTHVEPVTGKLPAMVGSRYDWPNTELPDKPYTLTAEFCTRINAPLIAIWKKHQAIIHITAGPPNPWNWASERKPFKPDNDLGVLLRNSTPVNQADIDAKASYWSSIDIIAGALQEFEDAGVPVVFRPFAEFNQSNKYYFVKQDPADFVLLWKDVYDYYVSVKGLHNLLFCWEVWALSGGPAAAALAPWYPGDAYVDVVAGAFYFKPESAIDYLDDKTGKFSFKNSVPTDQIIYDFLVSQNRPFGAAQYGLNQHAGPGPGDHNTTLAFMEYSPALCFVYYWEGRREWQRQLHATEFANHPCVATSDDLPNFNNGPVRQP